MIIEWKILILIKLVILNNKMLFLAFDLLAIFDQTILMCYEPVQTTHSNKK